MGVVSPSFELPRPFGPYELVRQLAVGGVAEVFLARARSVAGFEKAVALKMIHRQFSEDPEFARLLIEEANITSQLSHRNVVQVIDLGQIDGFHYIAMEYVDGIDLARLLARLLSREAALTPRVAAYIVREVCEGLEHAHRKAGADGKPLRLVHRDVSPANVLISFAGEVKLTDFGLAKAAVRASTTQAGVIKGKYGYMAPEQARGQAVDARADVFAAGVVLYEMLTGRPAYPDAPLPILLERVGRGAIEAADKLRPDLPRALLDVLQRATAVDLAQRHPNARALADDLSSFLYTQPPSPEVELARVLETASDNARNTLQPMGALLVEDSSDDVTMIETTAAIRAKFLAGRAPGAIAPAPSVPPPAPPEVPAPVRAAPSVPPPASPVSSIPPPGDGASRASNVARVRRAPGGGRGSVGFTMPSPASPSAPAPARAPSVPPPPQEAPRQPGVSTVSLHAPVPAPAPPSPVPTARSVVRAPTLAPPPAHPLAVPPPRSVVRAPTLAPPLASRPSPAVPAELMGAVVMSPPSAPLPTPPVALSPAPPAPAPAPVSQGSVAPPVYTAPKAPSVPPPAAEVPPRRDLPAPVPQDALAFQAHQTRIQLIKLVAAGLLALLSVGALIVVVLMKHGR